MSGAALLVGASRFLVGGRSSWIGSKPTTRQSIYFANHASNLDTVVLWAALPPALRARTRPVAAADYWDKGALRRYLALDVLGAVLIDRSGGAQALDPLKEALRDGASLIIFPEGTRGRDVLPAPFKSGLYFLAREFPDVDLIPVYLDSLNRAFPKGVYLPVPISVTALFGPPVRLEASEERDDFLARSRRAIVDLARELHPEADDA